MATPDDTRGINNHMLRLIIKHHFNEHISGEKGFIFHPFFPISHFDNIFGGYYDMADFFSDILKLDFIFDMRFDPGFFTGINA